jgi:3-oxoadipate enol-lactonase
VRVELDGFSAYYEERGAGAPLVLVHGLGANTEMWQLVAGPLAERFRVIAYDLRGLGQSETPPLPYTLEDLVGDLFGLADALELDTFLLVGHSLGGAVALAAALEQPERLQAVVGVAAPSVNPADERLGLQERATLARRDGMQAVAELHAARGLPEAFKEASPGLTATYKRILASGDPEGYAGHCGVLATFDISDLAGISVPTLLVAAELDQVVPPSALRTSAAEIPGCEYIELAGCGHVVPLERPNELAATIGEFAARHAH